ncbi:hypothetical protein, partial [Vibrio cholerae]|uniref:hypothetical protein n=1 Tax=Vibrio cholerae TaxID=666 RepID=UPI00301E5B06
CLLTSVNLFTGGPDQYDHVIALGIISSIFFSRLLRHPPEEMQWSILECRIPHGTLKRNA